MRGGWVERGTVLIRLSRPHFAFYRGYLDGLDIGDLAVRYLENAPGLENAAEDLRIANSAVKWICDQLLVAARRAALPATERLLRIAPGKLHVVYPDDVPTLDQFREERDPYEMYSEQDIIALFQDQYGNGSSRSSRVARMAKRNDRLRSRQLSALWQLEELVGADPKLTDGVDGWLDPNIAVRLKEASIKTLHDLINIINGSGYRWYTRVPKIGLKAAAQIVRWLTEPSVCGALGVSLHIRGLVPRRRLRGEIAPLYAPRTDIVPLEHFIVPTALDGSTGSNRGTRSLLSAQDDLSAIQAWLSRCKPDSHTRRSYRKEAERFLLWSIIEKGKSVSSLTVEDCVDYRDFLWHLGRMTPVEWGERFRIEQDRWLGVRGTQRWSPHWRPFEGPLSNGSQKIALTIIQALCQWLTEQHYLHGNPFKSIGKLARADGKIDVSRALTVAEWTAIKNHLGTMAQVDRYFRLRFIFVLAYSTGLRLSELALLRKGDLSSFVREGESDIQWQLNVTGKGGAIREVQLSSFVVAEMKNYFYQRGHLVWRDAPVQAPLIAVLPTWAEGVNTADDALGKSRLYDVIKDFFREVADAQGSRHRELTDRLRSASTHWLRHTFATHALQNGVALEVVRDLLGHRSLSTTSVYVTTERDDRSRQMEAFGEKFQL